MSTPHMEISHLSLTCNMSLLDTLFRQPVGEHIIHDQRRESDGERERNVVT